MVQKRSDKVIVDIYNEIEFRTEDNVITQFLLMMNRL